MEDRPAKRLGCEQQFGNDVIEKAGKRHQVIVDHIQTGANALNRQCLIQLLNTVAELADGYGCALDELKRKDMTIRKLQRLREAATVECDALRNQANQLIHTCDTQLDSPDSMDSPVSSLLETREQVGHVRRGSTQDAPPAAFLESEFTWLEQDEPRRSRPSQSSAACEPSPY